MTSVERVKQILKERGIKMAPFEKQCGFSNGYIGKLKEGFPDERLFIVADQLGVDPRWLVFGVSQDSEAEIQMMPEWFFLSDIRPDKGLDVPLLVRDSF